jgi:hypothetical protein
MDARMYGRTENIYSIFRDKLLLPGEHIYEDDILSFFSVKGQSNCTRAM